MKTRLLIILVLVVTFGFFGTAQGFLEDDFDTGRFSYFHYGEKFYQFKYHPSGTLTGDSSSRCHFTSNFILDENSFSESGYVIYKFPNDMVWPGGYENSTFFVVSSPSFNFPKDNNFEKIIPTKTKDGDIVLEFDLVPGLNTFVANSTAFWDSQRSQVIDCPNPFDFEKQDYKYYDFVYPLKVQQNRAKIFDLDKNDFLCKSELVLIQKYDGSPACVKEQTIPKLIERGWTKTSPIEWSSYNPIETEIGKFGKYELQKDNTIFEIKYHIEGGTDIKEIIFDKDANSIKISLTDFDAVAGSLKITLYRQLIDAKISENVDDLFFVFIDENEVPYTETTNETARTLTIQLEKNSKIIEIIGTVPIQG